MIRSIVVEAGQARIPGTLTRDEAAQLERVRMSRFFLVSNDGGEVGERGRCRRCGLLHMYLTYMCIERPFRGLEEGLRACLRVATDAGKRSALIRTLSALPDFGTAHPESARPLMPDMAGEMWYSVLIGGPEPIDDARALRLAQRINGRRPPIPFIL